MMNGPRPAGSRNGIEAHGDPSRITPKLSETHGDPRRTTPKQSETYGAPRPHFATVPTPAATIIYQISIVSKLIPTFSH